MGECGSGGGGARWVGGWGLGVLWIKGLVGEGSRGSRGQGVWWVGSGRVVRVKVVGCPGLVGVKVVGGQGVVGSRG